MEKDNKRTRSLNIIFFSILLIIIIAVFFIKLWFVPTLPVTFSANKGQEKVYVVKTGETINELANKLYKDKMIRSSNQLITDFNNLKDKQEQNSNVTQQQINDNNNLQVGGYVVNSSWSPEKIAKDLMIPNNDKFKEYYFKTVANDAKEAGNKYHVLPSLIIAHSAIESNYGMSELSAKYNNYFGIKTDNKKNGVNFQTKEVYNGTTINQNAMFLKCNSREQCFKDYAKTLANGNSWNKNQFKDVVGQRNYKKAAQGLVKDGYATDPALGDKIINLIKQYHLTKYDN